MVAELGEARIVVDLVRAYQALAELAAAGDVPACRLLLERLTSAEAIDLRVAAVAEDTDGPPLPAGLLSYMAHLQEFAERIATAPPAVPLP